MANEPEKNTGALEEPCPHREEWGCHHWCHECHGIGYVNTELGDGLEAFLRRRGYVIAQR